MEKLIIDNIIIGFVEKIRKKLYYILGANVKVFIFYNNLYMGDIFSTKLKT